MAMNDYDIFLDDLEIPEEKPITKKEILKEINYAIKSNMKLARTMKGIEIDVKPEWSDLLEKDGSIIRSYEKAGWKVRWWQTHEDGPATGRLLRSWLILQDADYVQNITKQKKVK
jgi:hypothetical protein